MKHKPNDAAPRAARAHDPNEAPTEAQRELDRIRRRQILLEQVGAGVIPFFVARHPSGPRRRR